MYFFLQIEIDVSALPEDVACRSQKRKAMDQEPISNCKRAHHALSSRFQLVEADQAALAKVVGETLGAACSANEILTAENKVLRTQLETMNKSNAALYEYIKELQATLETCGIINL
jgi:hypothetical protein